MAKKKTERNVIDIFIIQDCKFWEKKIKII